MRIGGNAVQHRSDSALFAAGLIGMVFLEPNGLDAGGIKRHPAVETILVTRDSRTHVMKKVLNWLMEEMN